MKKVLQITVVVIVDVDPNSLAPQVTEGLTTLFSDWIKKNHPSMERHPYRPVVTAVVEDWEGGDE